MADVADCLRIGEGCNVDYADDVSKWAVGKNLPTVKFLLDQRAKSLARFAAGNGLSMNASKTQLILGGKVRHADLEDFHVVVDGVTELLITMFCGDAPLPTPSELADLKATESHKSSQAIRHKIHMFETQGDSGDAMVAEFRDSLSLSPAKDASPTRGPPTASKPIPLGPLGLSAHQFDEQGLIIPKKIYNPCMESKSVKSLNKEIRWNAKAGVNVLGTKSELERAMEKRTRQRVEIEKKTENESIKTDFQKVLEERAKKIEDLEKKSSPHLNTSDPESGDSGHCSPEPEFVRVHAHLKHAQVGRNNKATLASGPGGSQSGTSTKTI
eukprot:maker-scaffold372_size192401-snap-gene-0.44 protein:Tk00573 transcript:maker-scaffold372_size192401-snap-gene-0.44-mRNA-1 annotation:"PREDICTED: uncharacterized protein LOC103512554"